MLEALLLVRALRDGDAAGRSPALLLRQLAVRAVLVQGLPRDRKHPPGRGWAAAAQGPPQPAADAADGAGLDVLSALCRRDRQQVRTLGLDVCAPAHALFADQARCEAPGIHRPRAHAGDR